MQRFGIALVASILVILTPLQILAGELTGFVAVDTRLFFHTPALNEQDMSNGPTLVIEPEYYHVSEDDAHTFTFRPFLRIDTYDEKRTHVDIRQLDWLYAEDSWELRAGASKVFWGVTESNHLVDIINQTDSIEDVDGEDKLGQPMIQLGVFKNWGNVRFFYLPYFRERSFAGLKGRLRSNISIEPDRATYDASAKEWHPDVAVRYSNTFGDWDIGVSHFSGTSREPAFIPNINTDGAAVLAPHYDLIDQTSTDIQYTKQGWLWKLEAMTRSGHGRRFIAATGGVEYTFFNISDNNMDLGALMEYQFDDRSASAPVTLADDDIFAGMRLTFNDMQDTAILGGASVDTNSNAMFFVIEASRRIANNWTVEGDVRLFANSEPNSPESSLRRDNHVQFRLSRYF